MERAPEVTFKGISVVVRDEVTRRLVVVRRGGAAERADLTASRNHRADPAARVVDIAGASRDDVDVRVGHGLTGGRAVVDADVVSVGLEFCVEFVLDLVDQAHDRLSFLG